MRLQTVSSGPLSSHEFSVRSLRIRHHRCVRSCFVADQEIRNDSFGFSRRLVPLQSVLLMAEHHSITSLTLLSRLRCEEWDEASWQEFVGRYGQKIYGWCVHRGLQSADAEEVTQNVLIKMATHLQVFKYDPARSFRAWLRTVTENAVKDYVKTLNGRTVGNGGSAILQKLAQVEATADLSERLKDVFDLELAEEAMARVSCRVTSDRWMAWHLTAREGRSGAEVSAELNMKIVSVYTARNQIQKMICDEILQLEKGDRRVNLN